jgi:transcriptional regulator with XRE-family HTH domain
MTQLEAERRRRGLTQTGLAYWANLTQSEVSQIERRRALPSPRHLERLGRALGLPVDTLMDEVPPEDTRTFGPSEPEAPRG